MKQVVLITGANGMLARKLATQLEGDYSVRFLTRKKTRSNEYLWDLNHSYIDPNALIGVNSIIHLAGSSIANKRWTRKRKQIILSSRVDAANLILKELKKHRISIDAFITASAIGYYGTKTTDDIYDENSSKGNDFLSDVCSEWEKAADDFKSDGIASRIAILRLGIVLAKEGGALKRIIQPIKFGLGSILGTGSQYMPWVHILDLVRLIKFILDEKRITGTFNAVSPEHVTHLDFTKTIAQLTRKPLLTVRIPKFIVRGLFGEMSSILLEGSRISSEKILNTGFKFEHGMLPEALKNILKDNAR